MAFLSDLAQNPWYIFACGCVIGLATALWVVWLFPEKRKEAEVSRAIASYTETRLRLRADPSGSRTLLQEMEINIDHWQQTIISLNSENNNLLHADTISMTFRKDTDYSRPIVDTFGHKVGGYNFYTLGKKGAVFQFFGGVQAPMLEIWFPPPDHYTKSK